MIDKGQFLNMNLEVIDNIEVNIGTCTTNLFSISFSIVIYTNKY